MGRVVSVRHNNQDECYSSLKLMKGAYPIVLGAGSIIQCHCDKYYSIEGDDSFVELLEVKGIIYQKR